MWVTVFRSIARMKRSSILPVYVAWRIYIPRFSLPDLADVFRVDVDYYDFRHSSLPAPGDLAPTHHPDVDIVIVDMAEAGKEHTEHNRSFRVRFAQLGEPSIARQHADFISWKNSTYFV